MLYTRTIIIKLKLSASNYPKNCLQFTLGLLAIACLMQHSIKVDLVKSLNCTKPKYTVEWLPTTLPPYI